ncbi:MAG: hypothetical protein ACFFFG_03935 [Candidatus Thorarchaeota archaeon]
MELTLEGKILTPIITKKTMFELEGCRAEIITPKRRFITKSHKKRKIHPFSFIGYLGRIQLTYRCQTMQQAKGKLQTLLLIDSIGRFWREGLGRVEWLSGEVGSQFKPRKKKYFRRVKVRQGLPHHLPIHIQKLIRYALLHDFVHTSKHKSKIYGEIKVEDLNEIKNHHEMSENPLIQQFQKYDRIAARMTRNIRSPRTNCYTWEAKGTVNFKTLAHKIEQVESNVWRLYGYIYKSKELSLLNESLNYGHSSLRYHLLLITNLIVQDFLRGAL